MAVATHKDGYSQHSNAQSSFPDEPRKGRLQGGAQKPTAFPHVWIFCCRKLTYTFTSWYAAGLWSGYVLQHWS